MTTPHPVSFEKFYVKYVDHLGDPDKPSCYIAYIRAEADLVKQEFPRRYKNYATFRNALSIQLKKRK